MPDTLMADGRRTVFIFHGRDDAAYLLLEEFCARLGLHARNFRRVVDGAGNRSTIEIIDESVENAAAILLLLTPDEYVALDPDLATENERGMELVGWTTRPNVLFEAGYAFATARRKTILTQFGYPGRKLVSLSNIAGINIITLNKPGAKGVPSGAQSLIAALRRVVEVQEEGVQWLLENGKFTLPAAPKARRKIVWGRPFAYPIPLMAAACAVGVSAGAGGMGAAWAKLGPKKESGAACPSGSACTPAGPPTATTAPPTPTSNPPPPTAPPTPTPAPTPTLAPPPRPVDGGKAIDARACAKELSNTQQSLKDCQIDLATKPVSVAPVPTSSAPACQCEGHQPDQCCQQPGLKATKCQ